VIYAASSIRRPIETEHWQRRAVGHTHVQPDPEQNSAKFFTLPLGSDEMLVNIARSPDVRTTNPSANFPKTKFWRSVQLPIRHLKG
jgi:hypothetical protein